MKHGGINGFTFFLVGVIERNFSLYLTLNESSDRFRSTNGIFRFRIESLDENKLLPT